MQKYYISIETNVDVFEMYKILWAERGVIGIRAATMTEGIEKAIKIEKTAMSVLYFVDIVADDIHYMPQLELLNYETDAPILIATSTPNDSEHAQALRYGADYYGKYCESTVMSIETVRALIDSFNRRKLRQKNEPTDTIIHNHILLTIAYRKGYVNDKEIDLSRTEFDTLYFLLCNPGIVHSYEKIYNRVWGNERAESVEEAVRSTVKRIRKKIDIPDTDKSLIENIRGVGFCFVVNFEELCN